MRDKVFRDLSRSERVEYAASRRLKDVVLVLVHIEDEKNISLIMRTAEALGVSNVIIVSNPKYKSPKIDKRLSTNAHKWLKVKRSKSIRDTMTSLKSDGYKIVASVVDPELDFVWDKKVYKGKIAILVGNESHGIPVSISKLADIKVYIPLRGLTESLNVAAASAILLYEVIRQKSG